MTSPTGRCRAALRTTTGTLLVIGLGPWLLAQDVQTSFEEVPQGSPFFVLGTSPHTVSFAGGEAKTSSGLYRSGHSAWLVAANRQATVTFETAARELTLYFRDQDFSVQSQLTCLDEAGNVIARFNGHPVGPDGSGFTRVRLENTAVKKITLANHAPPQEDDPYGDQIPTEGPYVALDDFSFAARPPPGLEQKLYFAHFADGGGLSSQLTVTNPSSALGAAARIELRAGSGEPMTVDLNGEPVVGEKSFSLPPLGTAVFATDGLGELQAGSVVVSSDQPLAGVILFSGPGVAGVGSSPPSSIFLAPVENDETGQIRTGVAIANLEAEALLLNVELRTAAGTLLGSGTFSADPIPAQGQVARFLDEFHWEVAPDLVHLQGVLKVSAPAGRMAATVLRLSPGGLSTLPVSPLAQ